MNSDLKEKFEKNCIERKLICLRRKTENHTELTTLTII